MGRVQPVLEPRRAVDPGAGQDCLVDGPLRPPPFDAHEGPLRPPDHGVEHLAQGGRSLPGERVAVDRLVEYAGRLGVPPVAQVRRDRAWRGPWRDAPQAAAPRAPAAAHAAPRASERPLERPFERRLGPYQPLAKLAPCHPVGLHLGAVVVHVAYGRRLQGRLPEVLEVAGLDGVLLRIPASPPRAVPPARQVDDHAVKAGPRAHLPGVRRIRKHPLEYAGGPGLQGVPRGDHGAQGQRGLEHVRQGRGGQLAPGNLQPRLYVHVGAVPYPVLVRVAAVGHKGPPLERLERPAGVKARRVPDHGP